MDADLLALAERCEKAGCEIICPFCGDEGFDLPGLSLHIYRWCDVERHIGMSRNNAEVAEALRARTQSDT